MKKTLAIVLALLMLAAVLTGCASQSSSAPASESDSSSASASSSETVEKLIMATNAEFPPYEFYENDKVTGIDAEIAAAIAEKIGMELEIVDTDFDSIVPGVQAGKYSMGMAGMTVNEDRLKSVDFTTPYATGVQVVIVKEGGPITSVDDLFAEGADNVVGVQNATTGDIYTTGDIEDEGLGTINRYSKGADAVQALISGKVDCVVIDNEPAKAFVEANADAGLKILDTEYVTEDYAICISKDNPDLMTKVNAALEELINDGTVKAIVDKYIAAE